MFLNEFRKIAKDHEKHITIGELYEDDDLGLPFASLRFILQNKANITKHIFQEFLVIFKEDKIKSALRDLQNSWPDV